jgi:carbon monoxide dehydrogenase subunit G
VIEARGSAEIRAAREEVFDFLADARNEPSWLPGAKKVEKVSDGPVGNGTRFAGTYARAGSVEIELVDVERPRTLTFRASSRIVAFDDVVTLEEFDGVTRLKAVMRAEPRGVMRLFAPLMGRTMKRQFEANWAHLTSAVEP